MPNAVAHRLVGAVGVGGMVWTIEGETGRSSYAPVTAGLLGGALSSLPDFLEPAIHPNHRGFFHSYAVLALLGYGAYRLWKWEPTDGFGQLARMGGLVVIASYGIHLVMDATTPKGLPIV
ncbi:MAG: metal-dependent hydrolase [Candidatus Thiodiazotropha sp. (ex Dulcina madagascariensis)]|nr:metal-dependent hydrolase [Candidatus Thiodiazotropha sp. (ex Dulcina madagascariensis)]